MRILGLIPARGGSKGIPGKNSKLLAGKPLLAYTIEAALEASALDGLVFSSEDEVLIKLAKDAGVEVPFTRPEHLATDTASSLAVVQHAIRFLEDRGEYYDAVCLLQVTTPMRTANDIDNAVSSFVKSGADALVSVIPVPHQYNPHWVLLEKQTEKLHWAMGDKVIGRRQDLPKAYIRDGSIYITKTSVIKNNSLYGESLAYFEMNPERHVNIDTEADWLRATQLLSDK